MVEHLLAKEFKAGATIHLTLNKLQSVDLSFSLPVAPFMFQCCPDEAVFIL
jgi:hypothetical protein